MGSNPTPPINIDKPNITNTMTDLNKKLTEAKTALNGNLKQFDDLRQIIIMQQGAVQMLEELIASEKKEEEADAKS